VDEVINLLETLRTDIVQYRTVTLLDRLNGERGLARITEKLATLLLKDPSMQIFFRKVKMSEWRERMTACLAA